MSLEWLDAAKALVEGSTRKIPHDCGPGECLQINHKPDGWSAYCHRCPYKWFVPRRYDSLSDRLERLAAVQGREDSAQARPWLPRPFVHDVSEWPLEARVWLYKAGLSNVDIARLSIYWNPDLERVVIPITGDDGKLLYWQARTLDKENPRKYLNPAVDKRTLVAKYAAPVVSPYLILTEDILSAYRISRAGFDAWSLLGTKLNDHIGAQILHSPKRVFTWLDPDEAGQKGALEIRRNMRVLGKQLTDIVSNRDPKLLTRIEIQCAIQKALR